MKELKFQTDRGNWLCFRHAAARAVNVNQDIIPIIDDFGSEYDFRNTSCFDCEIEHDDAEDSKHEAIKIPISAIDSVLAERLRQDAKWGEQNHEPQFWMGILGEEFGELCQAVNETVFNNGPEERAKGGYANMRAEAVQVAAVAVAFVEMLDRRYGEAKEHA